MGGGLHPEQETSAQAPAQAAGSGTPGGDAGVLGFGVHFVTLAFSAKISKFLTSIMS